VSGSPLVTHREPQARGVGGPRVPTAGMVAVLAGAVVAAFVYTVLVALDLGVRPPLPARIQAADVTGTASLLGDLTARLAAFTTLGLLTAIVGFTPKTDDHRLTPEGRRLAGWAGRTGQVWFWAARLNSFASAAYVNGVPIGLTFSPTAWWTFLWATPAALAWLVSALVALAIVVAAYAARQYAAFLLGLVAGVVALAFVVVTGNVSVGLNHDWATDAALAVTLAFVPLAGAAVGVLARGTTPAGSLDAAGATALRVRRYHALVLPLVGVAAAGHLLIAWQQLAGQPVTSQFYGVPTLGCFAVLGLLVLSWGVRQAVGLRDAPGVRALWTVTVDVALVVAYVAFAATENHIPPPRFLEPQSIQVNYLGYEVPVPPTLELLVAPGRPNLLWLLIVVFALGAYVAGMLRVRARGGHWPVVRLVAWASGWLLTAFLAVTGLWIYSTVTYSWHMVVHMTVNMMVPVLCVLGGPFALVRAASGDPDTHVSLGAAVDALEEHRPWQLVTGPAVAWVAYIGSLFLVYFTPLFPWLMKYHWAHQLMLILFMMTGYFFYNLVIGFDRGSAQLPHLIKLALVISIMPFHAVFAVGILSSRTLLGADFYQTLAMPWMTDLMNDQNIAGQATWFLGEVPLFVVMIALAAQWFRQDSRDAARIDHGQDAGVDDSFDAYNDMLAELAQRDAGAARRPGPRRPEP